MVSKIISGGQTGADRGGLDAAIHCKLPNGGWCPKGRKAEDGILPADYRLTEMDAEAYLPRTQANIIDSIALVTLQCFPRIVWSLKLKRRHERPGLC